MYAESVTIFIQQGYFLHFESMLHNLCFTSYNFPFTSHFHIFWFKYYIFHKACAKI